jgi:hypothetical protein
MSNISEISIIQRDYSRNPQTSNIMKIRVVRAEMFHAEGQTVRNYVA